MNQKKKKSSSGIGPAHCAIIMDGNGRWAKQHSQPRSEGHRRGAEVIESLLDAALEMKISVLSLYAFSTENWTRPRLELVSLWKLMDEFFLNKRAVLMEKGVRVVHSGFNSRLSAGTRRVLNETVELTKKNRNITINFCINYGGRQEIVEAVNRWIASGGTGRLTEAKLEKHLFTAGMPPVDLLIRTSGEFRISNFLLWQIAYSEMVFTDVLWPDFGPGHLREAVDEFRRRNRRFGGI